MDKQIQSLASLANEHKMGILTQEQIELEWGIDVYERIKAHLQMEAVEYPLAA